MAEKFPSESDLTVDPAYKHFTHVDATAPCDDDVVKVKKKGFLKSAAVGIKKAVEAVGQAGEDLLIALVNSNPGLDEIERMKYDLQHTDFITKCKIVSRRVASVGKQVFGDPEQHRDEMSRLARADKLLQRREITINLFAQCNTGKSTLLNAILGDSFLPVNAMAETGLRVLIQHDRCIHQCGCFHHVKSQTGQDTYKVQRDLPTTQNETQDVETRNCPHLEVLYNGKLSETVFGVKNIRERIKNENKKQRDSKLKTSNIPDLILKANVPLLADNVPEGWSITLIDNPGFGEAKEHITQVTSESWESSAAYIYLTSVSLVGCKAEVDLFKASHAKGLLGGSHDRLVIALTKIDKIYEDSEDDDEGCSGGQMEDVQARICKGVKDATNVVLPLTEITAVSGKWGLLSSRLSNVLQISDESQQKLQRSLLSKGKQEIPNTPKFTCGQGMQNTDVHNMLPHDIADRLLDASGVEPLKERIAVMVSTACIKIWAESLYGIYISFLAQCEAFFAQESFSLEKNKQDTQEICDTIGEKLSHIEEEKKALKATTKLKKESRIWRELDDTYSKDVAKSDAIQRGKSLCELKVQAFTQTCKSKIESKYTPRQFKEDLEAFLEETEKELQEDFNTRCSFMMLNNIVWQHAENAAVRIADFSALASAVCYQTPLTKKAASNDELAQAESFDPGEPPKLGDIKNQVEIPNVKLSFFRRLIKSFSAFVRRIRKSKGRDDDSEEPESEMENLGEDELDQPYRRWDDNLDKTLQEIEMHLSKECDDYFDRIKQRAIQYFYQQYVSKVKAKLRRFKAEYKEPLNYKQKDYLKMKGDLEKLRGEHEYACVARDHFGALKAHFKATYEDFQAEFS